MNLSARECDLSSADFRLADLEDSELELSDFSFCDFRGANLEHGTAWLQARVAATSKQKGAGLRPAPCEWFLDVLAAHYCLMRPNRLA